MPNFKLIGGDDLIARGVSNLAMLRPVLSANASDNDILVGNATLRQDEWLRVDERVNTVIRGRLTIVDDMRSRGLVTPVSVGTILRATDRVGDFDPADITFDGDTAPTRDKPVFERDTRPIPIISKEFQIGFRQLDASRQRGEGLDTTGAELAARKVRDKIQDLFVFGFGRGPNGNGLPGILTAEDRITVSLSAPWSGSGARPIADIGAALNVAYANNLFGPFILYVPKNWWAVIQADYETSGGAVLNRTVMQRILDFVDIEAIRPLDSLPNDNAVLVQLTRDVIDFSEAQPITTVQWDKNPFVTNFRVMAILGPHIKTMQTEGSGNINGIIHMAA